MTLRTGNRSWKLIQPGAGIGESQLGSTYHYRKRRDGAIAKAAALAEWFGRPVRIEGPAGEVISVRPGAEVNVIEGPRPSLTTATSVTMGAARKENGGSDPHRLDRRNGGPGVTIDKTKVAPCGGCHMVVDARLDVPIVVPRYHKRDCPGYDLAAYDAAVERVMMAVEEHLLWNDDDTRDELATAIAPFKEAIL